MKRIILLAITMGIASCLTGCAIQQGGAMPKSFSRANAPGWTSIELRDELEYTKAWNIVVNILVRDFEIKVLAKDEGYIQTGWLHSWSGIYQANYRVRVIVKFSDDRQKLELKPEAQYLIGVNWQIGVDSRLVSTLKSDLMGTLSRTTR